MPTAPLLIAQSETSYNTLGVKAIPETDVVAGDTLYVYVAAGFNYAAYDVTNDGPALTWVVEDSVLDITNYCDVMVWSTVPTEERANLVVTVTRSGTDVGAVGFIAGMVVFRGTDGPAAAESGNAASTAPSLDITTTLDASALFVINADYNAGDGSARVWRTDAGALVELTYLLNSDITLYVGYHPDAGAAGLNTVGLSAPSGQRSAIVAVEALAGILLDVYVGSVVLTKKR